jgi:hypothetical protein
VAAASANESASVGSSVISSEEAEKILQKSFELYPTRVPHEMDINEFKKLLREANITTTKFTTLDVEVIFRKTLAKVESLDPGNHLASGVIFGKRFTFPVFQQIAVPLVAQTRRCIIDDLVALFKIHLEKAHAL